MITFLKDYFFSFFNHQRAKNIYKHSFVITFINVIVLFFAIFLSSFCSQEISFKYYYNQASEFKEVLALVLPDEEIISGGTLTIDTVYNSFVDDNKNTLDHHFNVIIDARDVKTTFDDFTLVMVNENNESITYEEYLLLDDESKESYSSVVKRGGIAIDTIANISTYESYLELLENKSDYLDLKEKYNNGQFSELEYASYLYILYGKAYYPEDVYTCDSYGGLPTIRSYNASLINSLDTEENYIFFYQDGMECVFKSKGLDISVFGDFKSFEKVDLSINKISQIDQLILKTYKGSTSLRAVSFLFISFFVWFIFLLAFVLAVFVTRFSLLLIHKNQKHYTLKIMNLMSSFTLVPSLLIGLLMVFFGFILSKIAIMILTPTLIFVTSIIRTIIYYSKEEHPSDYVADEI